MGDGARQKLEENNIQIISGISGNIDEAVQLYMDGKLKSASSGCSGHEHNHGEEGCSCGNH